MTIENDQQLLEIAGNELRRLQAINRWQRVLLARRFGLLAIVSFLAFGWGYFGWQIAQWALK